MKKPARRIRRRLQQWDVGPVRLGGYRGWRLRRKPIPSNKHPKASSMVNVATIASWRADAVIPLLVDVIEQEGYKGSSLDTRKRPYPLSEEKAYRLALAFTLMKHTDSVRQGQRIVRAARGMEPEEAYLWYSYLVRAGQNGKGGRLAQALALLGEVVW